MDEECLFDEFGNYIGPVDDVPVAYTGDNNYGNDDDERGETFTVADSTLPDRTEPLKYTNFLV